MRVLVFPLLVACATVHPPEGLATLPTLGDPNDAVQVGVAGHADLRDGIGSLQPHVGLKFKLNKMLSLGGESALRVSDTVHTWAGGMGLWIAPPSKTPNRVAFHIGPMFTVGTHRQGLHVSSAAAGFDLRAQLVSRSRYVVGHMTMGLQGSWFFEPGRQYGGGDCDPDPADAWEVDCVGPYSSWFTLSGGVAFIVGPMEMGPYLGFAVRPGGNITAAPSGGFMVRAVFRREPPRAPSG